jgi:hypothetical protein
MIGWAHTTQFVVFFLALFVFPSSFLSSPACCCYAEIADAAEARGAP